MKNIQKRHIVRKAEIANEYLLAQFVAEGLEQEGLSVPTSSESLRNEYDQYLLSLPQEYMDVKTRAKLDSEIEHLRPLTESSAVSLVRSIVAKYSHIEQVRVSPYNKEGLKEGVGQKADLLVEVLSSGEWDSVYVSLKQYSEFSNPQVASGTFFSTIAGLSFDIAGRGSYFAPDGSKFGSKAKDYNTLVTHFVSSYGDQCRGPLQRLREASNEVHKLRYEEIRPSEQVLDLARKTAGDNAIPEFVSLLGDVYSSNPSVLKDRFLTRAGLKADSGKEMLYTAYKNGQPVTFNTLTDKKFSNLIREINKDDVEIRITRSGSNQDGQGVSFCFYRGDNLLLRADMPLTININGAWANEDRYCRVSKQHILANHRRPKKAMQLDTSTNVWVKLVPLFNEILKNREI